LGREITLKLSFILPGEPCVKQRPRMGRGYRVYTPQKTIDHEQRVHEAATQAREDGWPMAAVYRVTMAFFCGSRRFGDVDNYCKAALDGLNGAAFFDDVMVTEMEASRHYDKASPRTRITVEVLQELAPKEAEKYRLAHERKLEKRRAKSGRKKAVTTRRRPRTIKQARKRKSK
jgi:Holliday junction resolvase RusA-like endonuclease